MSQDPIKAQDRAQKRQDKWKERQERSRQTREELFAVRAKVNALRQQLAAANDEDDNEQTTTTSAKNGIGKQLLADDAQEQTKYTTFSELPISSRTLSGLERGNYTHMTRIQAAALPAALCGRDVLGAARTGSGKTLTFLIPVLERLWREQWDPESGVGALILSPTRELALQTFKVLQVVGVRHTMSAALLTGGRNVDEEKARLHAINIVVGTPGRVLHHMTESSGLSTDNLQVLVLDEADRLLDMGFRDTVTSILQQLPQPAPAEVDPLQRKEAEQDDEEGTAGKDDAAAQKLHQQSFRQTLLFSATQTRDVQLLGQMCMGRVTSAGKPTTTAAAGVEGTTSVPRGGPLFITDHALSVAPTPTKMCQNFIVVDLARKLDLLYLFLRRHPHDKIVVFASTQNQVRFMFLAFSQLLRKAKIPAMCLTGKMKQFRREEVFLTFCRCKAAVLFCTDIAARGLDFPMVHWVVQYDCPESPQTYVHRAGRTARAGARGVSLLFLTPSETPMLAYLHHKNVPMREIAVKEHMMMSTKQMFVALAVQGLKLEAQKACVGYLRSLHFASLKAVFKLDEVDVQAFAESLGLNAVPDLSLITTGRSAKNLPWDVQNFMLALKQQKEKQANQQGGGGNTNKQKSLLDDDDEADADEEEDKSNKTRRERHLEASDMFTSLQKAQRFNANKNKSFFGADDDDDAADGAGGADELFTRRRVSMGKGAEDADIAPLTAEDRMRGLSKHKQRLLVKSADLRVQDLNLNTRIKFSDDDDDDDEEDGENAAAPSSSKNKVAELAMDVADVPAEADREGYIQSLQQRVKSASADDKLRFREKRLSKMGRSKKKDRDGSDDDDFSSSYEDDDDFDGDNDDDDNDDDDLAKLLKAARGELYSDESSGDDEDDEDDDIEEEDADSDDGEDKFFDPKASKFSGRREAQQQQQQKRRQPVGGRGGKPQQQQKHAPKKSRAE